MIAEIKKSAVLTTAKKLLSVNNKVTTLEVKTQLRVDYPDFYWTQQVVSEIMGDLKELEYKTEPNGNYRIYSMNSVYIPKMGDKVVPFRKSLNPSVNHHGYSYYTFEQCPQADKIREGKEKFLFVKEISNYNGLQRISIGSVEYGSSYYLPEDVNLYVEPVVVPDPTPAPVATLNDADVVVTNNSSTISRTKALEMMKNNKGQFFTATFTKKDGTERTINCQYKGNSLLGYVIVIEAAKLRKKVDATRNINLQTIKSLKLQGKTYKVN